MDFNTGSDLVVTVAWRSAQVAAVSAAAMLAVALIVRRYLQWQDRVQARVIAVWRPLLTRIVLQELATESLPRLPGRHVTYLLEEWNALHDAVRGESTARLNETALKLGLDNIARHLMNSREIGKQILAIRTLGHLSDPTSWKSLQEKLVSTNALVSFYAAAALVRIDAQRAMPGIMLQVAERESWPGEAMSRLLVDAGADVAREPIRALMLSLEPAKVPPLLPWLSHVDAVLGSEVAVELLRRHRGDDAIVAAALLVLLDPAALPNARHFALSPDADVRESLAIADRQPGRPGRSGTRDAVDVRPRLVGALSRGAGTPETARA